MAGSIYSVDTPGDGKITSWVGYDAMACNFITYLGIVHNLKFINCLFQKIFISLFQNTVDCG